MDITVLGPTQGAAFLRLKKKAAHYLELAKKLEAEEKRSG